MRYGWRMVVVATMAMTTPGLAQQVRTGGQVRPRFEYREPVGAADDASITMRVRGNIAADLDGGVRVFLQAQDVRTFGEESSPLGDARADQLDLHQGWVEFRLGSGDGPRARIGRQELALGGQRLVGAVDWAQQGQAFDGVRVTFGRGDEQIDLFGVIIADDGTAAHTDDAWFTGVYATLQPGDLGAIDLYGFFNHDDRGAGRTQQITLGGRWERAMSGFRYGVEGSLQAGDRAGQAGLAFMLGGRVSRDVANGRGTVTLWYDYLSGDGNPADDRFRVFDTLFATNHMYYGLQDFFLDIPTHTGGRGLQDAALKTSYRARDDLTLRLDLHTFHLARRPGAGGRHLGEEVDLTATYRQTEHLGFSAGLSWFAQADGMGLLGRLGENATWLYAMTNVSF